MAEEDTFKQVILERRDQLNARLGLAPKVYIEQFQNWGRNQNAQVLTVKPKTLSEIQVRPYCTHLMF